MKHLLKSYFKLLSARKLRELQYPSGLFGASASTVATGYDKAWLRDNIYEAMGFESLSDADTIRRTYAALFDLLLRHEDKIDWAIKEKPSARYQYIHARYSPHTFEEFAEDWGNKQNDAVGAFLFKVGDLYRKGIMVIRDEQDLRILQKLVDYLASIEYWQDADSGMWEENEEVHASSVGACVAGLLAVSSLVDVPSWLIEKGRETLAALLPRESVTKECDLSLLSLIFPYNIVTPAQREAILANVESMLVRERGVLRYWGDRYYQRDGKEAEWTFGFPWLARIYKDLGDDVRYRYYLKKTFQVMTWKGEFPELYFGGSEEYNENTPLGWSQAMFLCALA